MYRIKMIPALLVLLAGACPAFAATSTLSVFTEDLRPVFLDGEEIDIVVVYKTSVAFNGGTGKLVFAEKGAKKARAVSFKVPKMGPGKHIEVFRIDTAVWKPAKYYFVARLGDLKSNRYDVEIVGRERPTNFGMPDIAFWGAGTQAYVGARYKPFRKANVNLVISAGTHSPVPLEVPPKLTGNVHWALAERKVVEFRQQWAKDLTKPAYEIHPERKRNEYALSNDGALRNRVSTGNKPFIIDDRTWMGVISFRDTVYQYGKRVLYYSANHRRYMNYLGVLFNDDPNMYWSPATSDCPARWSHLAPIGGRDFKSPGELEPAKRLHDGRIIFKGVVLNIGNQPKNLYWRKVIDIPFQPKEVKIEFYQADRLWFWVNGKRSGHINWGNAKNLFNITKHIKKGKNLFAVEGRNVGWLGYMGCTIRATDTKGKYHYWYSDKTWKVYDPKINDENKVDGTSCLEGVADGPVRKWQREKGAPVRDYSWVGTRFDDSEWGNAKHFGRDGKLVSSDVPSLLPQTNITLSKSKRGSYCWDWTADFSQFYRLASDAMYKVDSGMRHTTNQGLYWGPGCGEYTPSQYRALDYGVSILYTDQGEYPLSDSFDAERFQRGMKPGTYAWIGMANFSERNNVWLRGIRVAGRKVGGVGFFCGGGGIHSLRGWQTNAGPVADWEGRRFSMETLLIALQSYGDLFVGLKEDDKVAWLSTWTEETTGAWTWGRPWQFYHAAEAFYSLMRAHFPANIIEEREVLEDRLTLDKAKVLLISTRKVALPEEIIDKIKSFMKKGGKVLVTKCAPAVNIPGAIKVNLDMTQGMQVHNMPGWDGEGEYLKPEKRFKEYKDELRNKLYSAVTPFVDAESMWITMSVQKYGKAKYVFAVSDLYPPLYNSARKGHRYGSLSSDGYFSIPWRMKYTMPAEHRLYFNKSDGKLPEGFVVYDMFNQKLLKLNDPEPSAKGWKAGKRTLDIHFVNNPARILVCLPKPIEKLSLALSPSVKPGELLRTKIRVLASDGQPIDALFPVEVKITDPDGKLRYHVWRTGGPDKERMYKIATNDTPGKWTFWARELVSGCISENTFVVESDAADNLRIRRIADQTIVFDEYNVWDFLRNNQVEGPIYIVLGKPQKRLEPLARKLKAALESIGTRAQVKYYARSEAREVSRQDFTGEKYLFDGKFGVALNDAANWPRVYRNVIVLATSKRVEGKLGAISLLQEENEAVPAYMRGRTPNYPGPGWAIIQFSSSPFVFNYDVVSVYGHDDKGLEKGVSKLIEICRKTSVKKPLSPRLNFDLEGPVVGGKVIGSRIKLTANAPTTSGQKQSRKSRSLIAHRFGIPLRGAAISPNGKYIAVGTDGYGENLFVYNNKGKLLWQKKVGVLNVQFLAFSKDSRKLQCSSNVFGREKPVEGQVGPIEFKVENTSVFDVRSGRRLQFLFGKKDPLGVVKKVKKVDPSAAPPGLAKDGNKLTKTVPGKTAWTYTVGESRVIQMVALSPNGKWVGFSAWSGNQPWLGGKPILVLLNAKTGKKVWEKPTDGIQPGHNKVGLLDSGVMLLIDGDAQGRPMFNLLGPKAGKTVYSFTGMPGAAGAGLPFKIGPGGEWIMVQAGGTDPHIRIIYLTGKSRDKIIRFDDEVNQQQFTPDNSKLLAGVWENEVVMIDMATGKRLWTTKTGIGPRILFSSDYKFVLVTTFLGQVHYLNARNGEILWSKDLNAAEAVPGLHGKLAKWLDENTKEALESGHNINGGWNNIKKDVFYVP